MRLGASLPRGWVAADGTAAAEIRLAWQEDELPAELKNSPGYQPFVLSPEVQSWVDSMQEIKEWEGKIIGLPRTAQVAPHRDLSSTPAPPPSPPPPVFSVAAPPQQPPPPPPPPEIHHMGMPEIPDAPAGSARPATQAEHHAGMPDIAESPDAPDRPRLHPGMPDTGEGRQDTAPLGRGKNHPHAAIPEIGGDRASDADSGAAEEVGAMPEIGDDGPEVPRRHSMPEIG